MSGVPSDLNLLWANACFAGWEEFWRGGAVVDASLVASPSGALFSDVGGIGVSDVDDLLLVGTESLFEVSGDLSGEHVLDLLHLSRVLREDFIPKLV